MTQDPVAVRDRAEFLRDDMKRSVALQARLLGWRTALGWAAIAGVLALSVLWAERSPLGWIALMLAASGAVVFAIGRKKTARTRIAALVEEARVDAAQEMSSGGGEWDRSRIDTVPGYYLRPADVTTPEQLEGLLKPTPESLKAQFAEVRIVSLGAVLFGVFAVIGAVLFAGVPVVWLATVEDALVQNRLAGVPAWVLASIVSGAALFAASTDIFPVAAMSRTMAEFQAKSAEAELDRLWAADASYTAGSAIRWTPTGYVLDRTAMAVRPQLTERERRRRTVTKVLVMICAALMLALLVLVAFALLLKGVANLLDSVSPA